MDIEKLIEELEEISTKNSISLYKRGVCKQAAEAIRALQAEVEQTKLEKETLIEAVRGDCNYCKNNGNLDESSPCWHCEGFAAKEFVTGDYWQWRGAEKG